MAAKIGAMPKGFTMGNSAAYTSKMLRTIEYIGLTA